MMTNRESDVKAVEAILKEFGKSKTDLAECWGRNNSVVTNFFQNDRQLKLEDLDKMADMLGITTTELVARIRGEKVESWNDEIYGLALIRAKQAVKRLSVKIKDGQFAEFVYLLYKHALSEKRTEGQAYLTPATVELFLKQMLVSAN